MVQSGTDDILSYGRGIGKERMNAGGVVEVTSIGLVDSFKTIGK